MNTAGFLLSARVMNLVLVVAGDMYGGDLMGAGLGIIQFFVYLVVAILLLTIAWWLVVLALGLWSAYKFGMIATGTDRHIQRRRRQAAQVHSGHGPGSVFVSAGLEVRAAIAVAGAAACGATFYFGVGGPLLALPAVGFAVLAFHSRSRVRKNVDFSEVALLAGGCISGFVAVVSVI